MQHFLLNWKSKLKNFKILTPATESVDDNIETLLYYDVLPSYLNTWKMSCIHYFMYTCITYIIVCVVSPYVMISIVILYVLRCFYELAVYISNK